MRTLSSLGLGLSLSRGSISLLGLASLATAQPAQSFAEYTFTISGDTTTVILPVPQDLAAATATTTTTATTVITTTVYADGTPVVAASGDANAGGELIPLTINGYTTTVTIPASVFAEHPRTPVTLMPVVIPAPATSSVPTSVSITETYPGSSSTTTKMSTSVYSVAPHLSQSASVPPSASAYPIASHGSTSSAAPVGSSSHESSRSTRMERTTTASPSISLAPSSLPATPSPSSLGLIVPGYSNSSSILSNSTEPYSEGGGVVSSSSHTNSTSTHYIPIPVSPTHQSTYPMTRSSASPSAQTTKPHSNSTVTSYHLSPSYPTASTPPLISHSTYSAGNLSTIATGHGKATTTTTVTATASASYSLSSATHSSSLPASSATSVPYSVGFTAGSTAPSTTSGASAAASTSTAHANSHASASASATQTQTSQASSPAAPNGADKARPEVRVWMALALGAVGMLIV